MSQISVLIESMCGIRDNDLRLIEGKQVESYKNLTQMVLGPSGSECAEALPPADPVYQIYQISLNKSRLQLCSSRRRQAREPRQREFGQTNSLLVWEIQGISRFWAW
jgi:hypothetical protein